MAAAGAAREAVAEFGAVAEAARVKLEAVYIERAIDRRRCGAAQAVTLAKSVRRQAESFLSLVAGAGALASETITTEIKGSRAAGTDHVKQYGLRADPPPSVDAEAGKSAAAATAIAEFGLEGDAAVARRRKVEIAANLDVAA